jgi:hypothetical protein
MAPQELDPKQTDTLAKKKVDLEKTLGEQLIALEQERIERDRLQSEQARAELAKERQKAVREVVATGSAILAFSAALLNIFGEHTPAQATPSEQPTVVVQVVDPNHHITVEQKGSSSERPSEVYMDEPSEVYMDEPLEPSEIHRVDMAIPGKAMSSGKPLPMPEEAPSQEESIYSIQMSVEEALSYYPEKAASDEQEASYGSLPVPENPPWSSSLDTWTDPEPSIDPAGQAYDPTHPTKVTVTLEEMAAAANLKPEEMAAVIEQNTLQD